jgi:RimJ/RimL family protein N-acetyltransferase
MPNRIMIETGRLVLRTWLPEDLPEFIRVTNTPQGMRFLGGV